MDSSQEKKINSQQTHEQMLSIIRHQGNANENHSEIPLYTHQDGYNQKDREVLTRM